MASGRGLAAALGGLALGLALRAQAAPPAAHPSLDGLWTSATLTELERPDTFKTGVISEAAAKAFEAHAADDIRKAEIDDVGGRQSEVDVWVTGALTRIRGQARTSAIVEPADGQIPYSPAGKAARGRHLAALRDFANPETRPASERCVLAGWGSAGPPMFAAAYANEYRFVQTGDDLAIAMENNHELRIIRMKGPGHPGLRHLPANVRPLMGDSIGWWEGQTLVAETTNFNAADVFKTPQMVLISTDATVTERFTRLDKTHLLYAFTVDDPTATTRPWKAEMLFTASKGPMFEYACHEGNYSLPGILAGARRQEAERAAKARSSGG